MQKGRSALERPFSLFCITDMACCVRNSRMKSRADNIRPYTELRIAERL